jgi:glycerol-3-phosphate acyltransferase PlsX
MKDIKDITIAVDAMGGDFAPEQIVKGSVTAAKLYNAKVILVGKEDEVHKELQKHDISDCNIEVVHASEIIEMAESPTKAVKKKKDSSLVKCVNLVAEDRAQAFVSAGNTGACMTASFFILGRIKGIERPAIAALLPTINHTPALLLDAGANSDCEPSMLVQFAQMGNIFSTKVLGIDKPRVGVLNIGGEASKGNTLALNTHKLLTEDPRGLNFVGNVEGRDVFLGACDVIICDGFTGNVTLKVAEGVAKMLIQILRDELSHGSRNKLGAALARPAFKRLKKRIDYEEYGGSLLLGVNGITVIAHGGSNDAAIKNAIRVGIESVQYDVTSKIRSLCEMSTV